MQLTDGEKLIAMMMADIMDAVGATENMDPDFIREALAGGQAWAIKRRYHGIFDGQEDEPEVIAETQDILDMCRVVEYAIEALPTSEIVQFTPENRKVWQGFDANNESGHYKVALMLLNRLNLWQEVAHRPFNSRFPMLPLYRAQVAAFHKVRKSTSFPLPIDVIQAILAAR